MKTPLILTLVILFISSCESNNPIVNGSVYSNSYINNYYYSSENGLTVRQIDDTKLEYSVIYSKPIILVQRWNQTKEDRILLDSLCLRNHDVTYNREMSSFDYDGLSAWADNFISITVSSDADWDDKHKAGTSLDDIMTVEYESYREFIDSGYSPQSSLSGKKMLSDLKENDLWVLDHFYIEIQTLPTISSKHTLTVTLTSDLGKVYTGTVVYEKK